MPKMPNTISALRALNGLNIEELAEKMEVSHTTISNWERGKSLPNVAQWFQLNAIFNEKVIFFGINDNQKE